MDACELSAWLAQRPPAVAEVVRAMARACARISAALTRGGGAPAAERLVVEALADCPQAAGWSSAAQRDAMSSQEHACRGSFLIAFDALDEGGLAAGTLFSVLAPVPRRAGQRRGLHAAGAAPGMRRLRALRSGWPACGIRTR